MLIVNGGLPRSGTVLVGTIIIALLRRHGISWQRFNPQERRDLPEFAEQVRHWQGPGALLIHTHLVDQGVLDALADRQDCIAFWNIRDPRDALVSLKHLHDFDIQHSLMAMKVFLNSTERVAQTDSAHILRYETLTIDRKTEIARIAQALQLQATCADIDAIDQETSVDRHRAMMQAVHDGGVETVVHRTRMRTMREDPKTLINDRHIQSGAQGRWRTELTPADQDAVNDGLARWIALFGYDGER